jgi:RHS repeat-associated protein
VSRQVFADGGIERYTYTLSGNIVTAVTKTDSLGRTETMRFNAAGYTMGMADALGQSSEIHRDMMTNLPLSTTGPCGCPEATREFDSRGNVTAITDRLGQTMRMEYEPVFNNVSKITDKLGRITTFAYDSRGNLTLVTDALGRSTTYVYDGFGRLTSISDPLNHNSSLEYDANSNVSATVDELNHRTTLEYDPIGRLTATVDPLNRRTSMGYDNLDRVTTLTDPATTLTRFTYDSNDNLVRITNGLNNRWLRTYDSKNRLVFTTDPLNRISRFQYNTEDEMIAKISPSGRTTRYTYDLRGQSETITDPLNGIVRFFYDNRGNLTALMDERSNSTTFTYDQLYRLISRRDPLGQTTTFGYDAVGNMTGKIDRLGRLTDITYDPLNRPMRIAYLDALVTYAYDAAYRLTGITDSQSGNIGWSYDDADRVLTETTTDGVVSYGYNNANQRTSMTAADRPSVTYNYDSAGRLQTIAQGAETFTYSYDVLSRLTNLQRPNGVATAFNYDSLNRLERLIHNNAKSQALEDFRYAYNADDEIISIMSLASAQTLPPAQSVSSANPSNRIGQFGQSSFGFDLEGQTTTKTSGAGTTNYTWDARGRLTQTMLPGGQTVSYGYDALGRRVSRTAAGVTTRFLYDGQDVVLDRGSDGSAIDYLNGLRIDSKLRQTATATGTRYFLQDHLGSTAALTDASGNVSERMQYEAFGESAGSAITRYGFTGRERDPLTGLLYYRARWMDPQQGRFMIEDPIGFPGGPNLYLYVSNNPISRIDPLGLSWQTFLQGLGGGFAASIVAGVVLGAVAASGGLAGAVILAAAALYGGYQLGEALNDLASGNLCEDDRDYLLGTLLGGLVGGGIGGRLGAGLGSRAGIRNSVPKRLARVVPEEFANSPTLGRPGAKDVFVTAADDIRGINTSQGLAQRLTLVDESGNLRSGSLVVLEFDTPASGLASPVSRTNPGFVGRGRTAGEAREFSIPNQPASNLKNVRVRKVQ